MELKSIEALKGLVGKEIIIEDFSGKRQSFRLVRYKTDIISVKALDGEFSEVEIELDLGTASVLETPYIKRIFSGNAPIFSEELLLTENRTLGETQEPHLEISQIVSEMKQSYQDRIHGLLKLDGGKLLVRDLNDMLRKKGISISVE